MNGILFKGTASARLRGTLLPALLMAAAGVLAGCGGEDDESAPPTSTLGVIAEQPNAAVPHFGVDGELSSDDPPATNAEGAPNCVADYADGGRNPGLVKLVENKTFSFYEDRLGTMPIAEGCEYTYKGFAGDPHYFGPPPDGSPSSVWMLYELASGGPECEAEFKYVTLRPPHGDGDVKHMHMRFGGPETSTEKLLQMSVGSYEDADVCQPWWSVYCTKGNVGCDG